MPVEASEASKAFVVGVNHRAVLEGYRGYDCVGDEIPCGVRLAGYRAEQRPVTISGIQDADMGE